MIIEKNTIQTNKTLSKLTYKNSYHQISFSNFTTINHFEVFNNWLSGEFDLHLQEQKQNHLTIYFPNGHILVTIEKENRIIITVKNKNSNQCLQMMQKIIDFYNFYTCIHSIKH
ncbi:hypothetical protein [Tenacibaculum sp. 190524A02b]|uniref:Uncharacterized protein n=1 Tax=Tenacibaculum vairaonense TaxID=3137860 RepID=A0ABP1FC22_9FLAO